MSTDNSQTQLSLSKLDESQIVLRVAIASRILLLSLIILWRSLLSPYDTSATLNPNCLSSSSVDSNITSSSSEFVLRPKIGSAIEGSIVWDRVYFVRIAQCGYEYEQTYAFLPLLPICIYTFSRTVFATLVPIIGYRAVLGLSGYVINNIAFLFAAVYFYRLSVIILKDKRAALRASVLFCFNPASIFYSSIYSESLYSLFSLGGIYHLLCGGNTIAVLLFALSGFARSNGVLNAGYLCFQAMHQAYDAIFQKNRVGLAVQILIAGTVRSLCIFAPFIAYQAYGYHNICLGRLSDEMRPWCKARVPFLYDFLQGNYWGVGFLKYFQLKQLPNFLLASPILSLALCTIVNYVRLRPAIVFSLGFRASREEKNLASILYSYGKNEISKDARISGNFSSKILQEDSTLRRRKQKSKEEAADSFLDPVPSEHEITVPAKPDYSSILILPFILHLGFMAATAFFVMHVQGCNLGGLPGFKLPSLSPKPTLCQDSSNLSSTNNKPNTELREGF
ncbi:GPI mannosyltransferase 2 [Macleaya cordata]|uniref:GPI mannosyltransferase 2 n=1 Tax=Macleaya cordata TaxID=56857 RepID=A0A200RDB9_MACCD|nr:GPI mannosyltransferase 2 [Macleaya cordata]